MKKQMERGGRMKKDENRQGRGKSMKEMTEDEAGDISMREEATSWAMDDAPVGQTRNSFDDDSTKFIVVKRDEVEPTLRYCSVRQWAPAREQNTESNNHGHRRNAKCEKRIGQRKIDQSHALQQDRKTAPAHDSTRSSGCKVRRCRAAYCDVKVHRCIPRRERTREEPGGASSRKLHYQS